MQVLSRCALPVGSLLWQSRPSMWVLTVVARATFTLRPGESALAQEQEPLKEVDEHWGDDASRSLRSPSDMVPLKPRAEVLVAGHAHAPGGTATRSLVARVGVGEVEKAIEVFADRWFDVGGTLREGARFTRMPMIYERAASGHEATNPVGVAVKVDGYGRIVVPNLQPMGLQVSSASDYVAPIGFGALAPMWPGRREKLGRNPVPMPGADGVWGPLGDVDPSFFNSAPRDQQLQAIREDERIVLENLHPSQPRLVTSLPGQRPRATLERLGKTQDVFLRCDTLWIDSDRGLCTLTWRGQVALEDPREAGRVVVTLEPPAPPVSLSGRLPTESNITEEGGRTPMAVPSRATTTITAALSDSRDLPFAQQLAALREEAKAAASGGLPFAGGAPAPPPSSSGTSAPLGLPPMAPSFKAPPPSGAAQAFQTLPPSGVAPSFHAPPLAVAPSFGAAPSSPLNASTSPSAPPTFNAPPIASYPPSPSFNAPAPPAAPLPMLGASQILAPTASAEVTPPAVVAPLPTTSPAPLPPSPAENLLSSSGSWSLVDPRPSPMTVGQMGGLQNTQSVSTPVPAAPAASLAAPEAPKVASKVEPGRALQLVWFDPDCLPRVRRKPDLEAVFSEMEERFASAEHEEPLIARDPMAIEDRRDVFEALARGDALDETALTEAMNKGVQPDGRFSSPFVLLAGEVRFPFEELDTLRATLSIVAPFVGSDEALKSAVADARDFLQTPVLVSPPGVTEGFTNRVLEAFRKVRRVVSPTYVEEQTERVLLEKRAYQRRDLFGDSHVRALFQVVNPSAGSTSAKPWPLYFPSAAARKLPMFTRFQARLLADGCLQEDQFESHWGALRVAAIARVAVLPVKPERGGKP